MDTDKEKQLGRIMDYKRTFSTDHGKRVLMHLIKVHGYLSPSHVPGDSHGTAFNDGQKNVINIILKKLQIDIQKYEDIMSQQQEEHDEHDEFTW